MISIRMPLWLRVVSLIGIAILVSGAALFGYRYYTRPVTLTLAVGSVDGEAAKAMSAIAGELVSINASVRLKIIDTGTALEAAKQFAAGNEWPQLDDGARSVEETSWLGPDVLPESA